MYMYMLCDESHIFALLSGSGYWNEQGSVSTVKGEIEPEVGDEFWSIITNHRPQGGATDGQTTTTDRTGCETCVI